MARVLDARAWLVPGLLAASTSRAPSVGSAPPVRGIAPSVRRSAPSKRPVEALCVSTSRAEGQCDGQCSQRYTGAWCSQRYIGRAVCKWRSTGRPVDTARRHGALRRTDGALRPIDELRRGAPERRAREPSQGESKRVPHTWLSNMRSIVKTVLSVSCA